MYLVSVDKTFKSQKAAANALAYWRRVGRTARIAKITPGYGTAVVANIDFLLNKGEEAIVFKSDYSYQFNSARNYGFTKEQFLAKSVV